MDPPLKPRTARPVVIIPLEKMEEEGWTEECLRKAGARFYKKTMSWRVPMLTEPVVVASEPEEVLVDVSEQGSPGEKEQVLVATPVVDTAVQCSAPPETENILAVSPVTTTVDAAVQCSAPVTTKVDAAVQYVRPKFQYGKGPNEDVVRRMMRYLQQ